MADNRPMPRVSVVMCVYNGERHLCAALDSILGQTFQDFELIIIDDGSTDGSARILEEAAARDPRIVLRLNRTNRGLTRALNQGLTIACGAFIARQDADDLSAPGRLATQLAFFDDHPEVGLLGTAYVVIDDAGREVQTCRNPPDDTGIRACLLLHNAFCHSSVMFRRDILVGAGLNYDEGLPCSQDVDLWARLLKVTRGANLDAPLVFLRKHEHSVSATRAAEQQRIAAKVALREIGLLAPQLALCEDDIIRLRQWYSGAGPSLSRDDLRLYRVFFDLLDALSQQPRVDQRQIAMLRRQRVLHLLSVCRFRDLVMRGGLGLLLRAATLAPGEVLREAVQRLRLVAGQDQPG